MLRATATCGLLALLVGCGDSQTTPDVGPADLGTDAVQPPDIGQEDAGAEGNVGAPCDPENGDADCVGQAICLDVHGGGSSTSCELSTGEGCAGVCVLEGCTMEDITTPAVEDDCPEGSVCTRVPIGGGTERFCLRSCEPQVSENPCAKGPPAHAGVTCHPASIVLNDHTEVCLYPACHSDGDCGNQDPINPDSICLSDSGMCLSRGTPMSKVGSPCSTSADCGPYQSCLAQQVDASGKVKLEGGYCTVVGCKYHDQFYDPQKPTENNYWHCPVDSKCFYMGSGQFVSFCLATNCDPDQPPESDGCRDQSSPGQYDCLQLGEEKVCWLDVEGSSGQ